MTSSTMLKYGDGWLGLTSHIVERAPALRGAACVGKTDLFDPQEGRESDPAYELRRDRARRVCHECPVVASCVAWVKTIGETRVSGVLPIDPRRTSA